jgi:hypothetical protein
MKLNRMLTASVLGLSLLSTSAFACDSGSNGGSASHWSFLSWIYNPVADSHREANQFGQDSGRGNNCDHGRGNGGGYCGTGGSSSGGGSTSGGGSSTGSGSTGSGSGSGGSTGGGATCGPKGCS